MENEKLFLELIDSYYGASQKTLVEISKDHDVAIQTCEEEWQKIQLVTKKYAQLSSQDPSQLSLNKIMAFASEKAEQTQARSLWNFIFKPAYALLPVLCLAVIAWHVFGPNTVIVQTAQQDAQVNNTALNQLYTKSSSPLTRRLFTTPFDDNRLIKKVFASGMPQQKSYNSQFVLPVSLSSATASDTTNFDFEDDVENKLIQKTMSSHELETLYFRARKMEKMGYYQEALNDYFVLSKFYPEFDYGESLSLAKARCFEKMGDKAQAINILEQYQQSNGSTEDTQLWLDMLKSETF